MGEKGVMVDIYIRDDGQFDLGLIANFDPKHFSFHKFGTYNEHRVLNKIFNLNRKLKYLKIGILTKLSNLIAKELNWIVEYRKIRTFLHAVRLVKKPRYEVAFCIDSVGLYIYKNGRFHANKVVNVSLEILTRSKALISGINFVLKRNERNMLHQEIDLTVIQDVHRWELFKRSNDFTRDKFSLLPNSNRLSKSEIDIPHGVYFHELFNLPMNTAIVLSAGLISEEVSSKDISKAVGDYHFSTPVKVVFHTAQSDVNSTYLNEIEKVGGSNVLLSLKPLPYNFIYKVFNSSKIGLVIYNKNNVENMLTIGHSSGKLFQHLKYGIPVIASNLPGLSDLVLENKCGIVIDECNEIPEAIEKILHDYPYYSRNARKAFHEKFNIDIYLSQIYQELFS